MASVLDSSAILALLLSEPGAEIVGRAVPGAVVSSLNAAEVLRVLMRRGATRGYAEQILAGLRLRIAAFGDEDAGEAAEIGNLSPHLSLGDCACLALARRESADQVLTADRAWAGIKLGVNVRVIR